MVEHSAVNRVVVGSSPTRGAAAAAAPSRERTSGSMVKRLRHRPFTAVTWVQIPLESLRNMATWPSGKAKVCNTSIPGSNPSVALETESILLSVFLCDKAVKRPPSWLERPFDSHRTSKRLCHFIIIDYPWQISSKT